MKQKLNPSEGIMKAERFHAAREALAPETLGKYESRKAVFGPFMPTFEAYYVPPGHRWKCLEGAETIEFSPTEDIELHMQRVASNLARAQSR